jgi:hypothetical protein
MLIEHISSGAGRRWCPKRFLVLTLKQVRQKVCWMALDVNQNLVPVRGEYDSGDDESDREWDMKDREDRAKGFPPQNGSTKVTKMLFIL